MNLKVKLFNIDAFCIYKNCPIYKEKQSDNSKIEICETVCNFTAFEFNKWVKSQGFTIINNDILHRIFSI